MDKLRTYDHGTNPIKIEAVLGKKVVQALPTELHHKADGDLDDNPSFALVIEDANGNKVIGQVSLRMLKIALDELGYQLLPK